MGKMKIAFLALLGVIGVAAFAPSAKADEGRFGRGERFAHGYYDRDDGWRRERFERHHRWGDWDRDGWHHRYYWYR
jgi:hypothetical protein